MRVIVFGAGYKGKKVYDYIHNDNELIDKVLFFVDNDTRKLGGRINDVEIIAPDHIDKIDYDKIVVCGIYSKDIINQLLNMGINEEKIFTDEQYYRYRFALNEYIIRGYKCNEFKVSKKIVVYTAITGGYDELIEPGFVSDMIDYVCFTNNKSIKSEFWNIEYTLDKELDDMMLAKRIKLFPEIFFKQYEISVWVDAKYLIKDNLISYIEKYFRDSGMLFFPHPERKCIYDEAAECIHLGKGIKEDIIRQITYYFNDGYPFDNGLFEGGCIVRQHNDNYIQNIMMQWWEQISKFSHRDQISFPYVCWKNKLIPDICDLDINNNRYLMTVHYH